MKRIIITIVCMTVLGSALAVTKDLENDVTLVSYEQTWRDNQGTLSLRNNTDVEIKNVVFLITYLDMSNNELDYAEFQKNITIAPGMTKKLDIPAYEHDREYHYYKSEGLYDNTSFKIEFRLKDYNAESIEESPQIDSGKLYVWSLLIWILLIPLVIGLYIVVALMAKKRNRNVALWVLLSLIATPILIIIILLCVGKDEHNSTNEMSIR